MRDEKEPVPLGCWYPPGYLSQNRINNHHTHSYRYRSRLKCHDRRVEHANMPCIGAGAKSDYSIAAPGVQQI